MSKKKSQNYGNGRCKAQTTPIGHGESSVLTLIVTGTCRSYLLIETALLGLNFKRISLDSLFENILERDRNNK